MFVFILGWQQTNPKYSKSSSPYKQHESPPSIHFVRKNYKLI